MTNVDALLSAYVREKRERDERQVALRDGTLWRGFRVVEDTAFDHVEMRVRPVSIQVFDLMRDYAYRDQIAGICTDGQKATCITLNDGSQYFECDLLDWLNARIVPPMPLPLINVEGTRRLYFQARTDEPPVKRKYARGAPRPTSAKDDGTHAVLHVAFGQFPPWVFGTYGWTRRGSIYNRED